MWNIFKNKVLQYQKRRYGHSVLKRFPGFKRQVVKGKLLAIFRSFEELTYKEKQDDRFSIRKHSQEED